MLLKYLLEDITALLMLIASLVFIIFAVNSFLKKEMSLGFVCAVSAALLIACSGMCLKDDMSPDSPEEIFSESEFSDWEYPEQEELGEPEQEMMDELSEEEILADREEKANKGLQLGEDLVIFTVATAAACGGYPYGGVSLPMLTVLAMTIAGIFS